MFFSKLRVSHKLLLALVITVSMVCAVSAFIVLDTRGTILESRKMKTSHLVETAYGIIDYHYRSSV